MKVLKNLMGDLSKIHVDEVAVAPNFLLGEGVVIESGKNVNGRYLKFGDGTLICMGYQVGGSLLTNEKYTDGWSSAQITWTYPHEFSNITSVVLGYSRSSGGAVSAAHSGAVGIYNITAMRLIGTHQDTKGSLNPVAFGRWE